jgi:hypothetical protein
MVTDDEKKFPKHADMEFSFKDFIASKLLVKMNHQSDQRFER